MAKTIDRVLSTTDLHIQGAFSSIDFSPCGAEPSKRNASQSILFWGVPKHFVVGLSQHIQIQHNDVTDIFQNKFMILLRVCYFGLERGREFPWGTLFLDGSMSKKPRKTFCNEKHGKRLEDGD
ncbi:hypothetical protein MN608_07752 [Microdochium nivale]|nr:hypothetical protein MN608_07752 [Microdochium nivale]